MAHIGYAWSMEPPALTRRLAAITAECHTAQEYEAARIEWLHRALDCDTIYQGAVSPERPVAPTVTGVDSKHTTACEAQADRYWFDRDRLNLAARRAGGLAVDLEVLSARDRRESVFYREVMRGLRISATAVAVLELRGEPSSAIWFGRIGRACRFDDAASLATVRDALPVLALGDALFPKEEPAPRWDLGLTAREDEVLAYVSRGLTNVEIAALLGTSRATVKNQVATILKKTGASNRTELTWLARGERRP